MLDVSIIIVNYNTKELTNDCIESVMCKTSGVNYEIILVDNASIDGSIEFFKENKNIKLIASDVNLGFGKANNLGYSKSHGKYIFLLNSDTVLLNNAVKLFYDKMEECDERIACMGCFLQDAEGNRVHSYAEIPTLQNLMVERIWGGFRWFGLKKMAMDSQERMKNNPSFFEVGYVTGADLFIRRTAIEKCGLFDPDFFMYYEDPEMEFRYSKNGYQNYIYDKPLIAHLEGKSFSMSKRKTLIILRSCVLYLSKTSKRWKVVLFRLFLMAKFPYFMLINHFDKTERKEFLKLICNKK